MKTRAGSTSRCLFILDIICDVRGKVDAKRPLNEVYVDWSPRGRFYLPRAHPSPARNRVEFLRL